MDTALELRMTETIQPDILLQKSTLVKKLTAEFKEKPLYAVWRIIALSEIPHTAKLTAYKPTQEELAEQERREKEQERSRKNYLIRKEKGYYNKSQKTKTLKAIA